MLEARVSRRLGARASEAQGSPNMIAWSLALAVVGVVAAGLLYRPVRRMLREIEAEKAKATFTFRREALEAKFLELAAASGKPRGLRWEDCEFQSPVAFVRDKATGELAAFIEVTISFSAIPGGGMEGVAAVGNLRHATAVFHYHRGHWGTGGKALFNMNPSEVIAHFQSQYETLPTAP